MIIDTHAHLMFKDFKRDLEAVINRAKTAGVEKIVNVGCDLQSSKDAVKMAGEYENLYATLGLHPYDSLDATEELMAEWEKLINENKKIVAIGECGLDYAKAKVPKGDQKKAFRMHLELARKTGLPVIIHNREADEDTLEILSGYDGSDGKPQVYAVFHCFGSDVNFARKVWYKGYLTSFTGIVTYPTAEKLQEVVSEVPMDMFMVETDCPYLSPQKYRGGRNEPSYVRDVVEKIAEIKSMDFDDVARISGENAGRFFLRMGM
ncbi:MAG: TatD family hydrolase [Candidatus Peregrinibacteria bacterium]